MGFFFFAQKEKKEEAIGEGGEGNRLESKKGERDGDS